MNYNYLRYFSVLAQLEHYTLAAARLGISQPSLSSAIHHLETELGVQLFEKVGRNIRLTEEGRFYQEKVVSSDKNSKRSGISRMFSSGSVIDPSFVRSRVADIRSALDRREKLRRFLETESLKMKNVPDEIKYRRNWIYQGDSRHGAWLEMVGKELF